MNARVAEWPHLDRARNEDRHDRQQRRDAHCTQILRRHHRPTRKGFGQQVEDGPVLYLRPEGGGAEEHGNDRQEQRDGHRVEHARSEPGDVGVIRGPEDDRQQHGHAGQQHQKNGPPPAEKLAQRRLHDERNRCHGTREHHRRTR